MFAFNLVNSFIRLLPELPLAQHLNPLLNSQPHLIQTMSNQIESVYKGNSEIRLIIFFRQLVNVISCLGLRNIQYTTCAQTINKIVSMMKMQIAWNKLNNANAHHSLRGR